MDEASGVKLHFSYVQLAVPLLSTDLLVRKANRASLQTGIQPWQ